MPFQLSDKTILLGVCGSIAAYKACELASRLTEGGAIVLCALTHSAQELVRPATFEAITGNPVITKMFSEAYHPEIEHISVAQRAQLFLIAPATANMIAKVAHGIADDWLSTTLLATRAPLVFAPAMNTHMYLHPATQTNIALLRERGVYFVGPGEGRLACGMTGIGRMADIQDVLDCAAIACYNQKDLSGKKVLISSGPNHEPIDPMRYIGNRSSGKMGRCLALEFLCRGAEVCVVSGPSCVPPPYGASVIHVTTADEMYEAMTVRAAESDIIIGAAAVADYKVANCQHTKIKRGNSEIILHLTPNRDIIASIAKAKKHGQIVVGFAAETDSPIEHGQEKLLEKQLDLLIVNTIGGASCAVGSDLVQAWILGPGQSPEMFSSISKDHLAHAIVDRIHFLLSSRN